MSITFGELVGNFILVTGSVIILLLLIKKFAWGAIESILQTRSQQISRDIDQAEQSRLSAQQLEAKSQANLDASRSQASKIISDAKEIGQLQADKLVAEATDEAKRLKEKALTDIEQSKSDAISAVKTEMSDLTVLLAEKIMGANLDKTAQSQLIDSYLDDLGEA
ncbi:F0F1 ATP synthase subunit B [Streptococcus pyogenes]|uniref:F0F1 ATP synthase subunit B n=1 Tax=Streptococcus pyogenes TaxID=1314 RepID=UPI00109C3CD9|nr:F0F1 ATP synthase subunit B [Streptococcus pyogenes]VHB50381.1 F0F1 ATP synthase subunit B [Streptococcus pyogenes]VHC56603.1 F0F1 ATP synthase subunit B [Streptococcus pyogenes]VHC85035.1 F0F1 ATP synthase subunit B [Streptococcus pyogenes]VHM89957.1 F0F1 ATP synthase subunit B [Streptococcus pyogenes]HEP1431592.1 F0F1 ATP synthase subunit B [Streptococcus pyogenes]